MDRTRDEKDGGKVHQDQEKEYKRGEKGDSQGRKGEGKEYVTGKVVDK